MLCVVLCFFFFFFKQKTAYEMRISDWSSDVCSSDLRGFERGDRAVAADEQRHDHVRENDDVTQRKKGIRLRHYGSWTGPATGRTALLIGGSSLIWRNFARIQCRCAEREKNNVAPAKAGAANGQLGRASCRERVCQYG